MPSYFSFLIVLLLGWGAFAFGAVYDWAYTPLLWTAAAVGTLGCLAPVVAPKARVPWAVVAAVALLAAAVGLQLFPLTPGQLSTISPAADRLLGNYDLGYAVARSAPAYRHPLSIDPAGTRLGLACLAAFALLLLGIVRGVGARGLRTLAVGLVV